MPRRARTRGARSAADAARRRRGHGRMGRAVVGSRGRPASSSSLAVAASDAGRATRSEAFAACRRRGGPRLRANLGLLAAARPEVASSTSRRPTRRGRLAPVAAAAGAAVVSGTTGLDDVARAALRTQCRPGAGPCGSRTSASASSCSPGSPRRRRRALSAVGRREIVEAHHRHKGWTPRAAPRSGWSRPCRAGEPRRRASFVAVTEWEPGRTKTSGCTRSVAAASWATTWWAFSGPASASSSGAPAAEDRDVFARGRAPGRGSGSWGRPPRRYGLADVLSGVGRRARLA